MRLSSVLRLALLGAVLCLSAAACGGGGTTTVIVTAEEKGGTGAATEAEAEAGAEAAPEPRGAEEVEAGGVKAGGSEGGAKAAGGGLASFQSPSGNIGCYIGPEGARCDIAEREWSAPRPADCPSQVDAGQGLEVGAAARPGVRTAGSPAC